jgi:hypothetical protein
MTETPGEPVLVKVTVNLVEVNLDKLFLAAASGSETPTDVINRAIAFYYVVMSAQPGDVIRWKFADGSTGRLRRLKPWTWWPRRLRQL